MPNFVNIEVNITGKFFPLWGPSWFVPDPKKPRTDWDTDATFTIMTPDAGVVHDPTDPKKLHFKKDVWLKFFFVQNVGVVPNSAFNYTPCIYPVGFNAFRTLADGKTADGDFAGSWGSLTSLPRQDISMGLETYKNFPKPVPYLIVHYAKKDGELAQAKWRYSIMIQDNQGDVGVIDPEFENDAT